jgi:hypothetical protein
MSGSLTVTPAILLGGMFNDLLPRYRCMRIPKLTVRITRSAKTRRLKAHAIQAGADGELRGVNILQRYSIYRIETAKKRARQQYLFVDKIEFVVNAEPDWERSKSNAYN